MVSSDITRVVSAEQLSSSCAGVRRLQLPLELQLSLLVISRAEGSKPTTVQYVYILDTVNRLDAWECITPHPFRVVPESRCSRFSVFAKTLCRLFTTSNTD